MNDTATKKCKHTFERKVDNLGRIVLPVEWRRSMGIEPQTAMTMQFYNNFVVLMQEDNKQSTDLLRMIEAAKFFPANIQPLIFDLIDLTVQ